MPKKKRKPLTAIVIGYELYITAAFFAFVLFLSLIATLSHCMPSLEGGFNCVETPAGLNPFDAFRQIDFSLLMILIWVIGGGVMLVSYFVCRQYEIDKQIKSREKTKFKY